jgi:hypothetical protein
MIAQRRLLIASIGSVLLGLACATLYLSAEATSQGDPLRLFGLWRLRHVVLFLFLVAVSLFLLLYAISRAATVYFAIIAMTATMLFFVLEVAGRAGIVDWNNLLSPKAGDLDDLGTKAISYRSAEGVTYQDTAFLLGLDSTAIPFEFNADRHGFRNIEDRKAADIILLGDSMLVGALVAADMITSARLDALLPASVMQVALIGIGVQEQHQLLRDSEIDVSGRTVVQFVFEGNDLLDSRSYRLSSEASSYDPSGSFALSMWNLATLATGRSDEPSDFDSCTIDDRLYTFLWTDRSFLDHEDEIGYVTDALHTFADEVQQRGGRFLVVFVPTKFRVLADLCSFPEGSRVEDVSQHLTPLREQLDAWAKTAGIRLFDLTVPLQKSAREGSIPWFWGDTHWNEVGHEVTARSLAQWSVLSE